MLHLNLQRLSLACIIERVIIMLVVRALTVRIVSYRLLEMRG